MKTKKIVILSAIFLMPSLMALVGGSYSFVNKWGSAYAQQLPFSSQYYTNSFVVNPAFTGNGDYVNAFLTHRSQWTGLAGAPQTSYLTVDGPLKNKNMGLGMRVHTDVTDIISRVGAFANYSYKLKLNDSSHFYFGVALGALGNQLDFSKAVIKDNADPFLFQQSRSKTIFSADIGVAYVWKRLTVGLAVPQLFGNSVKYTILNDDNSFYNLKRHYQGTIKYEFDLIKEKGITAYPLVMFRAVDGAPFQYDINGVVDWKNKGWLGLTYHSNYAFAISAGARYKNFSIGYAYDIAVNKVRSYLGTTSEFLLGYTFTERNRSAELDNLENNRIDTIYISTINKDSLQSLIAAQLKANENGGNAGSTKVGDSTSAFILAKLVDEQGNPLSGANIEVINKLTNEVVARPTTNSDGSLRIAIPPGKNYDVVFNKTGYLYKPVNVSVPDTRGYQANLNDITLQKLEVGKKVVLNNILFDLNQAILKPESYNELDQTAKLIKEIPSLEMEISGHTDNVGSEPANQQLSEQRAKAVMDYLVSKGCEPNRLSYKGYGAGQPIASNATDEGRKINRRTEFKVLKIEGDVTVVSGANALAQSTTNGTQKYSNSENDALIAQLKQKTDSYQQQIDELKTELVKSKISNLSTQDANFTELKAKSDNYASDIAQLKAELGKASTTSSSTTGAIDDKQLAKLQEKIDTNQRQIEQLKWELTKVKLAAMSSNTNTTNTTTDNSPEIAALKAKSESSQTEINGLKAEIEKLKGSNIQTSTTGISNPETDKELAALKAKSESSQTEINVLKAEIEKLKSSNIATSTTNSTSTSEAEKELAALKAKSEADQAEINRLKAEQDKAKLNAIISGTNTVTPTTTGTNTSTTATNTTSTTPTSTPGVRTYKTADFTDDKGRQSAPGFYVIIGAFGSKENAEKFKAYSIIKGHATAKVVQNQITKIYNVVVVKTNNREDADAERAKYKAEYPDLWILKLE